MYGLLATVFFLGFSRAATVFLNPPDVFPSRLSPPQANLVLAAHLGLEQFEVVDKPERLDHLFREQAFVGKGEQSALLLLIDEAYARDVVPPTLAPSFSFSELHSDSLPLFLKTCTQRASHVYTHVAGAPTIPPHGLPRALDLFSTPTPAHKAFLAEAATLVDYLDAQPAPDRFAALAMTSVPQLAAAHGRESEAYQIAVKTIRVAVDRAVARGVRFALVAYASGRQQQRGVRAEANAHQAVEVMPLVEPVRARSSCFASEVDCLNATSGCSGHGQCTNVTRAGQGCFVCACARTISETGKVQHWAGEMCERRDMSGPFVLITGTVVTLILLMGGAVSLLYAIDGQALPSILIGGVTGGARRE